MALLLRPSLPPPHLRLLLRRMISAAAPSRLLPPPSHASSARLLFGPRVVAAAVPRRNGVAVRAFMASTAASDAVQENRAGEYTAANVQVLEALDGVRKRPGMYIGSTGPRGLHHLVYEILDNAVDEAQAGYASKINVVLHDDNSVSVVDNGRGIPTDIHPQTKKSCVETVLTLMHAGGKFGGSTSSYSVAGGLHGVGLSVVNALSEALEVTVWRDGKEYQQSYSRGKALTTLTNVTLPDESSSRQGTRIRFWPDKDIFTTTIDFDFNTISSRIRELAFLNPELTITLTKKEEDEHVQHNEYCYAGGLVEYVKWLNTDKKPLHEPIAFGKKLDGIMVDVSLQWCSDSYSDTMLGYANSIRTIDGGTHIEGLKTSLTRTINSFVKKSKTIKDKDISLSGEHVREGMTCVIAVKVPNPEFEGQTKTRLGNPEVRRIVEQSVQENLTEYLELHPDVLDSILTKSLNALKAALAAKRARELVRTKSVLKSSSLPGKLADCASSNPEESEIFIVEGDSAGGSAKQGRDRKFQPIWHTSKTGYQKLYSMLSHSPKRTPLNALCDDQYRRVMLAFKPCCTPMDGAVVEHINRHLTDTIAAFPQAILPLRGKILNIERKDEAAMYKNEEIQNLILGLGLGVKGEDFKKEALRYHKIVILTDADVDGAHIRTLLLTFFFRYQRALFDEGFIYVGVPPLYKVERGKQVHYCYDEADLKKLVSTFPTNASYNTQRFKGLGEMMPTQLWETTMDPERRLLKQLRVEDAAEANVVFSSLMGARVDYRKQLIQNAANTMNLEHLDI